MQWLNVKSPRMVVDKSRRLYISTARPIQVKSESSWYTSFCFA